MAMLAQAEREAICRRIREALEVARARGLKLGNPNGSSALRRACKGGARRRGRRFLANTDVHAQNNLAPVIADIQGGCTTSV